MTVRAIKVILGSLAVVVCAVAADEPPKPADLGLLDPMVGARIEEVWRRAAAKPDDAGAWLELAEVYHAHDLTDLAADCYRRAIELEPARARVWYLLALAQSELGEPEAAGRSLDRVVELTQGYAPAFWRQGRWLLEQGRGDEAEAAFRRSTEVDPDDLAGWVGLARVLLARGEARQAVDILFRVLAVDPTNGVAGQLMGNAFRALGEEEAARRALTMGTGMGAHFPDPWQDQMLARATGIGNRLRLLSARLERGEVDAVIKELEELRDRYPEDVGILNKLSEGYLHRRDLTSAAEVLQVALALDPGEFATLMHLAQTQKLEGDLTGALAWVDRAIGANPGHWQAFFERAGILGQMGLYSECQLAIATAMTLGANQNPNAWLMQGDVLLRLGNWTSAAETFDQALSRFPFLGPAYLGLALARAEQGRFREAEEALAQAQRLQQAAESIAQVRQRIDTLAGRGE